MSQDDPAAGRFHVDKRVPVALIFAMFVQTAGIVWWAATLQAAQTASAIAATRLEVRIDRIEIERNQLNDRVIRIEEKIVGQSGVLDRILRSVEREPPNR